MAGARRLLWCGAFFTFAFGVFGTDVSVGASYDQVSQACLQCDYQFGRAVVGYQNQFGLFSNALDGAKYHCRNMANVSQCYENCQAGSIYTYSSSNKAIFDLFYRDYCDPACYVAILPFCYLKAFGVLDASLSCDGRNMNTKLRDCLREELFEKQNCSSACTPGQRKALFIFLQLHIPCLVPFTTEISCYTSVQYCTEKFYGDSGSDYSGLTDPVLARSNAASCKYFNNDYYNCLETALAGTVTLGDSSYATTYEHPCSNSSEQVTFLEQFADAFLAAPFCNAVNSTLEAVCRAYVTTTTRRTTSATTARATTTTRATTARATTATSKVSTAVATSKLSTLAASVSASGLLHADVSAAIDSTTAVNDDSTIDNVDGENSTFPYDFDNSGSSLIQMSENSLRLHVLAVSLLSCLLYLIF